MTHRAATQLEVRFHFTDPVDGTHYRGVARCAVAYRSPGQDRPHKIRKGWRLVAILAADAWVQRASGIEEFGELDPVQMPSEMFAQIGRATMEAVRDSDFCSTITKAKARADAHPRLEAWNGR